MKKLLAVVAIFGFIGVAVFGFMAMGSMHGDGHTLCLATIARSIGCTTATSGINLDFIHTGVFHSFSRAILSAVIFLSMILVAWGLLDLDDLLPARKLLYATDIVESFQPQCLIARQAWLKLQEKRDPASSRGCQN